MPDDVISGISPGFPELFQSLGQVAHVLLTRSPLGASSSLDLHVLSTPPAFVLSQDQTLHQCFERDGRAAKPNRSWQDRFSYESVIAKGISHHNQKH